jgi:hypothetical protein
MEFLVPIVMFMCIASVLIFRPLTKRLGNLIDASIQEKKMGQQPTLHARVDPTQLHTLLGNLERRLDLFEQRLDFTESILENQERPKSLARGDGGVGEGDPAHASDPVGARSSLDI